jgi:hypothetical protein
MKEAVFCICVVALLALFCGEPDLLDALIYRISPEVVNCSSELDGGAE